MFAGAWVLELGHRPVREIDDQVWKIDRISGYLANGQNRISEQSAEP